MENNGMERAFKIVWLYIKYQLFTKLILVLFVFPTSSWIMKMLLNSKGKTNISSGDFFGFIFSIQGGTLIFLGLVLLTLLVGIDINAFIIIAASIHYGHLQIRVRKFIFVVMESLKNFLSPLGLLLMLYIAIVIPIVGVGFTITPMEGFTIPNFIKDVIFKNRLYSVLYTLLILVLSIISVWHLFVFHYIVLLNQKVGVALKNARKFMRKHWRSLLVDWISKFLLKTVAITVGVLVIINLIIINADLISDNPVINRMITVLGILLSSEISAAVFFITMPFVTNILTVLFYRYNLKDGNLVELKPVGEKCISNEGDVKNDRFSAGIKFVMIAIAIIAVNIFLSAIFTIHFDEAFKVNHNIEIIAHRGGGDLGAENSLAGLQAAIAAKASYSEIDVQRTKDGKYIINHDNTFKRLAGVSKKSTDLTLAEIKQLRIKDLFNKNRPSQQVATIEEFLDASKGRVGLLIELKGSTADEKMADDIIAMVKGRGMLGEVAVISLNYSLIKYIEENYPEVETGFLYFFSIGETSKIKADILIMEEREASARKIEKIQSMGKKAFVWTVNSEESIDRFVKSGVDGIITDHILALEEGIKRRDNRKDYEIFMDTFLEQYWP